MTTIAAYAAGQDDLSPGTRRVDAANQRDAWLRQMELAQLAGMGGTPVHAAPTAAQPGRAAGSSALAPSAAQVAHRPAARDATVDVGAGPDAAPAASAGRPDDAGPGSRAAGRPADDDTAAITDPLAAAAPAHPPQADVVRADDTIADLAALPPALTNPAQAAVTAGADALRAAAPAVTPAVTPAVAAVAPLRASLPAAPAAKAPSPHDAPETGEAPDWQKRVMHLTGDGDDVQLWIRDGELSPAQTQQLVARLAGDVAAMGLRLKEATVNGKPALRAPAAAESDAFVPPITHPTTER
jgi:hypothetical protein